MASHLPDTLRQVWVSCVIEKDVTKTRGLLSLFQSEGTPVDLNALCTGTNSVMSWCIRNGASVDMLQLLCAFGGNVNKELPFGIAPIFDVIIDMKFQRFATLEQHKNTLFWLLGYPGTSVCVGEILSHASISTVLDRWAPSNVAKKAKRILSERGVPPPTFEEARAYSLALSKNTKQGSKQQTTTKK